MSEVIYVAEDNGGQRIDVFLVNKWVDASREKNQKNIVEGFILVNNKKNYCNVISITIVIKLIPNKFKNARTPREYSPFWIPY